MSNLSEEKTETKRNLSEVNNADLSGNNLQENRAAVLENHLRKNKDENYFSTPSARVDKDAEISKIKEEINKIKNAAAVEAPAETKTDDYKASVDKLLFNFRNEINSPINSIEYSTENLQAEYERIINYFGMLSGPDYPAEALDRVVDYVNVLMENTVEKLEPTEIRERKKTFLALLKEYEFKNSKRGADYFVESGVYFIDDELLWIFSQPKAEILFDLMIAILSVKQSFEVLTAAKSRTRYLISNLFVSAGKEAPVEFKVTEQQIAETKKQKRQLRFNEIKPVLKMAIILLNLFAIFNMLFHIFFK